MFILLRFPMQRLLYLGWTDAMLEMNAIIIIISISYLLSIYEYLRKYFSSLVVLSILI